MELKDQLEAITAEVKASEKVLLDGMKKQAEEMKALGETTTATANEVKAADERNKRALVEQAELYAANQKKMQEQLDEIEKKAQRPRWGQPQEDEPEEKSIGERFTEMVGAKLDYYKKSVHEGTPTAGLDLKGFDFDRSSFERKALTTTETDRFTPIRRVPGFVPIGTRRLRMRDLFQVIQMTESSVEYVRELGFSPATEAAVTSITRSSQVATLTTTAAHGYRSGDYVYVTGATQTEYNGRHQITVTTSTAFTYTVTGSPASPATTSTAITVVRLNNFGAAAGVAEGALKPEAKFRFSLETARAEVIAHYVIGSRQVFNDLPGLQATVNGRLIYGLGREEERQALYGVTSSNQMQGLMTLSGTQSRLWSQGEVGDTRIDALRRAVTPIEDVEQGATGAVINNHDWESIELTKGSDDHYILMASPSGTDPDSVRLWRLPIVVTPAMNAGDFTVGAFGTAAKWYDREQANIRFADQHDDQFVRNLVTTLAEERCAIAWEVPEAFVIGQFDSAPV